MRIEQYQQMVFDYLQGQNTNSTVDFLTRLNGYLRQEEKSHQIAIIEAIAIIFIAMENKQDIFLKNGTHIPFNEHFFSRVKAVRNELTAADQQEFCWYEALMGSLTRLITDKYVDPRNNQPVALLRYYVINLRERSYQLEGWLAPGWVVCVYQHEKLNIFDSNTLHQVLINLSLCRIYILPKGIVNDLPAHMFARKREKELDAKLRLQARNLSEDYNQHENALVTVSRNIIAALANYELLLKRLHAAQIKTQQEEEEKKHAATQTVTGNLKKVARSILPKNKKAQKTLAVQAQEIETTAHDIATTTKKFADFYDELTDVGLPTEVINALKLYHRQIRAANESSQPANDLDAQLLASAQRLQQGIQDYRTQVQSYKNAYENSLGVKVFLEWLDRKLPYAYIDDEAVHSIRPSRSTRTEQAVVEPITQTLMPLQPTERIKEQTFWQRHRKKIIVVGLILGLVAGSVISLTLHLCGWSPVAFIFDHFNSAMAKSLLSYLAAHTAIAAIADTGFGLIATGLFLAVGALGVKLGSMLWNCCKRCCQRTPASSMLAIDSGEAEISDLDLTHRSRLKAKIEDDSVDIHAAEHRCQLFNCLLPWRQNVARYQQLEQTAALNDVAPRV